jgi:hypothetical protein
MRNTADVTGGKPIAVLLQSISGVSAINPLVAFYDIHGGKRRCYSFILSRTPHETIKPVKQNPYSNFPTTFLCSLKMNLEGYIYFI